MDLWDPVLLIDRIRMHVVVGRRTSIMHGGRF